MISVPGATAHDYLRAAEIINLWNHGVTAIRSEYDTRIPEILDALDNMHAVKAEQTCRELAHRFRS